jgi:hypothetical protein
MQPSLVFPSSTYVTRLSLDELALIGFWMFRPRSTTTVSTPTCCLPSVGSWVSTSRVSSTQRCVPLSLLSLLSLLSPHDTDTSSCRSEEARHPRPTPRPSQRQRRPPHPSTPRPIARTARSSVVDSALLLTSKLAKSPTSRETSVPPSLSNAFALTLVTLQLNL